MYTTYFGFRDEPFSLTPAPHLFYTNAVYEDAYVKLLEGIRSRRGFLLLTGEVGAGKTTLLRRLMDTLNEDPTIHTIFSYYSTLSLEEFFSFICHDLGLTSGEGGYAEDVQVFSAFLRARAQAGETIVLMIDEAQDVKEDVLEHLFAFAEAQRTEEPCLQILLVGQYPELDDKLKRPGLLRAKQAIAVRCQLAKLGTHEVSAFIHHRLRLVGCTRQDLFSPGALRLITHYSRGIPRLINLLCDNALRATQAASQSTVSPATLLEVAKTLHLAEEYETRQEESREPAPSAKPVVGRLARVSVWGGRIAIAALVLVCFVFALRAVEGKNAQKNKTAGTVLQLQGQEILARLAARYLDVRPLVWGLATETPALALLVPEQEWRKLSKEEQVALTLYLESLIPAVRADPDSYLEEFRTMPGYKTFHQRVANLCGDCWVIGAGELSQENAPLSFTRILVQGDSLWRRSLSRNQGVKASEFRAMR